MSDAAEATAPVVRLPLDEWLHVLDADYIDRYIRDGGAAVKVAVGDEHTRRRAMEGIHRAAGRKSFVIAHVDASTCKVHLVNSLFNKVAESVTWRDLARDFVRDGLAARHYPSDGSDLDLTALASRHGVDVNMLRKEVNQLLTDRVLADKQLTREMRMAIVQLCQASTETTDQSEQALVTMEEWLRGDLRYISALKSALIFR